jgi:hypothetical protein
LICTFYVVLIREFASGEHGWGMDAWLGASAREAIFFDMGEEELMMVTRHECDDLLSK